MRYRRPLGMQFGIVCESCDVVFLVQPYRARRARFCSKGCRSAWVAAHHLNDGRPKPWAAANLEGHRSLLTRFRPGHVPWNLAASFASGGHATRFVGDCLPWNDKPIGAITVRKHANDGRRAYIKIGRRRWKIYAVHVWETNHGPVPAGHIVHHRNENTLDDRIENLECMSREHHAILHNDNFRRLPAFASYAARRAAAATQLEAVSETA